MTPTIRSVKAQVFTVARLTDTVAQLFISADGIEKPNPGQFFMIRCGNDCFLSRPLSCSSFSDDAISFVFEIKGKGTSYLSKLHHKDSVEVLGPLGHGFEPVRPGKVLLVGGGLGVAPLLFAAQKLRTDNVEAQAILGFNSKKNVILEKEFRYSISGSLNVCTIDGTYGYHGNAVAAMQNFYPDDELQVLGCGPEPMLKALTEACLAYKYPCQVSLEKRMACGTGMCKSCSTETIGGMCTVCAKGPAFDANKVVWS